MKNMVTTFSDEDDYAEIVTNPLGGLYGIEELEEQLERIKAQRAKMSPDVEAENETDERLFEIPVIKEVLQMSRRDTIIDLDQKIKRYEEVIADMVATRE